MGGCLTPYPDRELHTGGKNKHVSLPPVRAAVSFPLCLTLQPSRALHTGGKEKQFSFPPVRASLPFPLCLIF